jgi:rubrerythrin
VALNPHQLLNEAASSQEAVTLYICNVCGYIAKGAVPENCPVCQAVQKKFKTLQPAD